MFNETKAEAAYHAYNQAHGHVVETEAEQKVEGQEGPFGYPVWDKLSDETKNAWDAVVQAVAGNAAPALASSAGAVGSLGSADAGNSAGTASSGSDTQTGASTGEQAAA